jgi:hypothetical protein
VPWRSKAREIAPVPPAARTRACGSAGQASSASFLKRLLEVFAAVAAGDMVFPFADIN